MTPVASLRAAPLGVGRVLAELLPGRARRLRRAWVGHDRAHIEVRGAHREGTEPFARRLEDALGRVEGVHWAEVNAVLGRVVVAFDGEQIDVDDLVDIVEGVEEAHELHEEAFPAERPEHPGDAEPLHRQVASLAADALGLGLSSIGRALGRGPLTEEVASLLSLVDSTPRLREQAERRLGTATADLLLATANAVSQGIAQGPLGLLVDATHRLAQVGEITARREVWHAREPELHGQPSDERTAPLSLAPRPVPMPAGPVERYGDRAAAAAMLGAATTWIATRNHNDAVAALVSGTPKAARLTREVFASTLGRLLWRRGIVPLDATALRRLDRVDTVVVDAPVLMTGRAAVGAIEPTGEAVERLDDLRGHAAALLDPHDPHAVRRAGGWVLGPLPEVTAAPTPAIRAAARRVRRAGGQVLGLTEGNRLVAVLGTEPELDGLAGELLTAAAGAGTLLVAGEGSGLADRVGASGSLPGGTHLAGAVRELQAQGHVVALVAARGAAALEAADCGIGLLREGFDPPWGADLLCGPGLAQACRILDAAAAARTVSQRGTVVALYGSVAAALLALSGPRRGATSRALLAVNGAAAVGMGMGAWSAGSLDRRPDPLPTDGTEWHALSAADTLARLGSTPSGLTGAEASRRHAHAHVDAPSGDLGLAQATVDELANPLTPALATGVGMSAASGAVSDAVLVGSVMGLNALLGAGQRLVAQRAVRRLEDQGAVRVHVVRGGESLDTTADAIVVGDVIDVRAGDTVPADARVLESSSLEMDESTLTGESQLVRKDAPARVAAEVAERTSMLYEGTVAAAGRASAVVVATGAQTEAQRSALAGGPGPTAGVVQARLRRLTGATLPVALGAGAALVGVDLLRGRPMRTALGTGVSLAVAAVPEGLPLVATVGQLAAARRLSQRGALVRNPATIEALGRVDVLCFDKTGTLTEGHASLRLVSDGTADAPVDELRAAGRRVLAAALRASMVPEPGEGLAHPTDTAVVAAAAQAGLGPADGLDGWRLVADVPFESARGYHATLGATAEDAALLAVKGAPEVVLPLCTTWTRAGRTRALDAAARAALADKVDVLARQGYRVLAVGQRPASARTDLDEDELTGLSFLGLLALADPVRTEAAEAVAGLRRAGIDVVMATGDHPSTAESIAVELGILDGGRVLTGPELDALDDAGLDEMLPGTTVFARVTPAHKVRLVAAMQRAGRTVAMTGDGTNDAAAIRLADVGVALGRRGTDAARQAADLVVTDDRIESIIDAIVEGRSMWASVRHAVSVLLGGNLGEIAFTLGSGLLSRTGSVLNARQLLLVNLMTDLLPSLALAVRPPVRQDPEALLDEGPDRSLAGALTRDVVVRAVATAGSAGGAWVAARGTGTRAHASTVALVSLVGAQLGQTAVAGWRSPTVLAASAVSAGGLVAVVQTPGVSHFFGCRPLGPVGWSIALTAAGLGTGAAAVLPRLVPAPTPHPTTRPTTGRERSSHEPHDAEADDNDGAATPSRHPVGRGGGSHRGGA